MEATQKEKMRTVTVVPTLNERGETIWVEQRGLGDIQSIQSGLSTAQGITTLVSQVQKQVGAKPTNRTLNDVADISYKVAAVAVAIPVYGTVIAAVATVIGTAATVLSGVFGNDAIEASKLTQNTNADLRAQIDSIDAQTLKVNQALQQIGKALNASGFHGFGDLLTNIKNNAQEEASTKTLQELLVQKGKTLQALIEIYNQVVRDAYQSITTKSTGQKVILWGTVGLAGIGLTWYLIDRFHNKKSNERRN